jgi:hypothetical protein
LEYRGDHADRDSNPQKSSPMQRFAPCKQVEGSDGSHHKASGLHRAQHVVRVLCEGPRIQQQSPETGQFNFTAGQQAIAGGMLHPGVCSND